MNARVAASLLLAALLAALAAAQESEGNGESPAPRAAVPTEGFWPTRVMIDRVLDRITEEMTEAYDLTEEQTEKTRALLKEHVPRFLEENRAEIQSLMNQFFEVQLAGQPPTPEEVAGWSQRVLPLMQKLEGLATQVTDQMRTYMSDEQVVRLEGEIAAFHAGLTLARNKLNVWAGGGYDPQTEWVFDRAERRRREREERRRLEQEMQSARAEVVGELPAGPTEGRAPPGAGPEETARPGSPPAAAAGNGPTAGVPATQPAGAKDEWEQYVEDFSRRYELKESQKQDALRILRALQKDRDDYLRRKAAQLEQVAARLRAATGDAERQKAAAESDRLHAPLKRMFQQLKDRLDRLPTRAQREAAARRAPDSGPAATRPGRGT